MRASGCIISDNSGGKTGKQNGEKHQDATAMILWHAVC